jgi:hypothetical protein
MDRNLRLSHLRVQEAKGLLRFCKEGCPELPSLPGVVICDRDNSQYKSIADET